MGSSSSKLPDLVPVKNCSVEKLMGTWFVQGVKPTIFEKTNSNAVEKYTLLPEGESSHDIDIDFQYNKDEPITSPIKSMPQKGWVQGDDRLNSGLWKVSPLWPIKMPYLVLEVDDDYQHTVIGYPNRNYAWIMSRHPVIKEETYEMLKTKLVEKHQYDLDGLRRVPQFWTAEEREKRGLTSKEIPDSMLSPSKCQKDEATEKK